MPADLDWLVEGCSAVGFRSGWLRAAPGGPLWDLGPGQVSHDRKPLVPRADTQED